MIKLEELLTKKLTKYPWLLRAKNEFDIWGQHARNKLSRVFRSGGKKKDIPHTSPVAWSRSPDFTSPLVTGKDRPELQRRQHTKTRTGQILAALGFTLLAGLGETIRLDNKLQDQAKPFIQGRDCDLSTNLPDPITHPTEWTRLVQQWVKCTERNDRDAFRTTPIFPSVHTCNRRIDRELFARFYNTYDAASWRNNTDRISTYNRWHSANPTIDPREFLASTEKYNGQFTVTPGDYSFRAGGIQRRATFTMGTALNFDVFGLLNTNFEILDHEILYWHIHTLLREAKKKHQLKDAVQRIFGITPYCSIMDSSPNEPGRTHESCYGEVSEITRSVLIQSLTRLNYRDRLLIFQVLRSMVNGSDTEISRCANYSVSDCNNLYARNNDASKAALKIYFEISAIWYNQNPREN